MIVLNIKADEYTVEVTHKPERVTAGNIETVKCVFDLSSAYTDYVVRASFNGTYKTVTNGECYAPILKEGKCKIGVYGCIVTDGEYEEVLSPKPTVINVQEGSFKEDDIEQGSIPASDYDELEMEIAAKLDKNQGASNVGKVMTVGADGVVVPQTGGGGSSVRTVFTPMKAVYTANEIESGLYDVGGDFTIGFGGNDTLFVKQGALLCHNVSTDVGTGFVVGFEDSNLRPSAAIYAWDSDGADIYLLEELPPAILQIYDSVVGKQDALTAGTGISISAQNVISATVDFDTTIKQDTLTEKYGVDFSVYDAQEASWANDGKAIKSNDMNTWRLLLAEAIGNALDQKADVLTTYTKTQTDTLLAAKQGTLTAGDGISISNDTITCDFAALDVDTNFPNVSKPIKATDFNTYMFFVRGIIGDAIDGKIAKTAVKQATGASTSDLMSQKAVTDNLALKADASTTYTKTQVDVLLDDKADAWARDVKTTAVTAITLADKTKHVLQASVSELSINVGALLAGGESNLLLKTASALTNDGVEIVGAGATDIIEWHGGQADFTQTETVFELDFRIETIDSVKHIIIAGGACDVQA